MKRIDCLAALAILCAVGRAQRPPSTSRPPAPRPARAATRRAARWRRRSRGWSDAIPPRSLTAMQEFRTGQRPGNRHGPDRQGLHRRRDQGDRGLVRGAEGLTVMTRHVNHHHVSRRDFLKRTAASAAALSLAAPAIAQERRRPRRGRGRRLRRRDLRARAQAHRSAHHGDAGRGEPDLHRLPVQQHRDRRPARPQGAAVRLQEARRRQDRRHVRAGDQRRRRRPHGDPQQRRPAALRPAGAGARHRHPLGRPARLQRSRRRAHAACLARRRADAAAAQAARSRWTTAGWW